MRKALLLLVVLAGFLTGCDKNEEEVDPSRMGYEYYPLEIGNYRIYKVTNIKFQHNVGDTTRFQMKERVDTSFYDQTNKLTYKIIRSVRPNENSPWVDDSVMVVSKLNNMVLLTKDNTKYVKMVFPVKEGLTWLGDAYNNRQAVSYSTDGTKRSDYYLKKDPYTYQQAGAPYTHNGTVYPKSVTIVQGTPTETWIGYDDRKEVYAEGVGMVYSLYNKVVYCNQMFSFDCEYATGYKLQGLERHEELIEYGKE